ncbi:hypothetical protein [uncultured Cellulomonas sp.]|uniref:hypothetical protein n=1 Tax=uncultured Cellulomonas sp. TaxID=189682 RepID=UPI0028E7B41B|nr:hypothetical protein [uncultured Cellulomonas sp.]
MRAEGGLPHVLQALDEVEAATRTLRGAAQTEWRSEAADRFRAALDEAQDRVRRARIAIEHAVQPVAAADLDASEGW